MSFHALSSEYESVAIGLSIAKEMKKNKFKVVGDSNLVVRQTDGTFALKEISLAPYQSLVQKLCDEIDVELTHVNRSTNRHADSLATLASKIKFVDAEAIGREWNVLRLIGLWCLAKRHL